MIKGREKAKLRILQKNSHQWQLPPKMTFSDVQFSQHIQLHLGRNSSSWRGVAIIGTIKSWIGWENAEGMTITAFTQIMSQWTIIQRIQNNGPYSQSI